MNEIFKKILIAPHTSVKAALKVIDDASHKSVVVVGEDYMLMGVASDGDIRRWILNNGSLDAPIERVMNRKPHTLLENYDCFEARRLMEELMIEIIPVVDNMGIVKTVCFWKDLFNQRTPKKQQIDVPVVIMAGGKGTRLYPFTKILPKPLIPIGDKPIVEHIIDRFTSYGCTNFTLSVNYKSAMIRAYFQEINSSYTIEFIEEEKPLGTAGSLHLLNKQMTLPFFVNNCDIVIDGDYCDMMTFHCDNQHEITIVGSLKSHMVPYGVLTLSSTGTLESITEKPELTWLVNTGMYILNPDTLSDIPNDRVFHITDLIQMYLAAGRKVGVYPVSEKSWMDMGQFAEMKNMVERFGVQF